MRPWISRVLKGSCCGFIITICFDEISDGLCAAGCSGWSGWRGEGGKMGVRWQGEAGDSELTTHLREAHLFPSSSPDGQGSPCQDPAGCLSHWKRTQRLKHWLTQRRWHKHECTQTVFNKRNKLQSGLSENVRTLVFDLVTSAPVTPLWRRRSAFQQTREQTPAFDAALPRRFMPTHQLTHTSRVETIEGWHAKTVISRGGSSVSVSSLVAKRICRIARCLCYGF